MLLNEIDGQTFRFRRDPSITSPLERAFIQAPSGLPILAPEIALLYKSSSLDPDNWADFRVALPTLSPSRRTWLRAALAHQDAATSGSPARRATYREEPDDGPADANHPDPSRRLTPQG